MGILDALRGKSEEEKSREIEDILKKELGGELQNIRVDWDKDGSVKVTGVAKWHATKQRVADELKDVKGVKKVDIGGITVKKEETPAATARPAAPAAQPAVQTYTIKSGDSLSAIAKQFYGDANQWNRIYQANKDVISDPNMIHPGQTIKIPK